MACSFHLQTLARKVHHPLLQNSQRPVCRSIYSAGIARTINTSKKSSLQPLEALNRSTREAILQHFDTKRTKIDHKKGSLSPTRVIKRRALASGVRAMASSSTGAATAVQAVFIFMHGLGDSGDSWEGITWDFKDPEFMSLKWKFPNAPIAPVSCNGEWVLSNT